MLKKTYTAALAASAIALSAGAASAVGIQFNVVEADIPTNNAFVDTGVLSSTYGITNLGFGNVLSAEANEDLHQKFWYTYEDSKFRNDYLFEMAGVEIGETVGREGIIGIADGVACALVNPSETFNFSADCLDIGSVDEGFYSGDDMEFVSDRGTDAGLGDAGFGIFYDKEGYSPYVFLAYADQGTGADADFDDLIVKTKGHVNVVPLPAAGWMLLAGVGGLVAMKRRKRADA
jgi:hypothetical protein